MEREITNVIKFRHELKYYINEADAMTIKRRLSLIASPDEHVCADGTYKIRSLYFETPTDRVLREKIEGVNNREKFRIRLYNDDPSFIRLEKKTKVNGLCSKISAPVTAEECRMLLDGNIGWAKKSPHGLVRELAAKMTYEQLKPKTVVDYVRTPFAYRPGNVRVTIDSDIVTGVWAKDLLDPCLPTVRTHANPVTVLEIKYDDFLPDLIRQLVLVQNRNNTAFSKYADARIFG